MTQYCCPQAVCGGRISRMHSPCLTKSWCPFVLCLCPSLSFRATPMACGSSQPRGWVGAAGAGLHHSSWQCRVLNPLRDRTRVLMDTDLVRYHCAMMGLQSLCPLTSHSPFPLPPSPGQPRFTSGFYELDYFGHLTSVRS